MAQIFWWCLTSVPPDEYQIYSILYMLKENWNIPWPPVAEIGPGFLLVSCECMEDPINLKLVRYFVFILPKNILFWVSSHAAKICWKKKKLCTERQLAQPPRQLWGWLRWKINDNLCIYNFVKDLNVNYSFLRVVEGF